MLGPFVWFSGGVLFLFLKKFEVRVVASAGLNVFGMFPGITLLSAILVFIKSSLEGSGGGGSHPAIGGRAVLHEPGTRKVLFFVYIDRSMMGLAVKGHFILGSLLNFGRTWSLTKSRIHPRALCSKRRSVYMWKLFFHPFLWWGLLSCSSWNEMVLVVRPATAALINSSFSVVFVSSSFVYHSISKCRIEVSSVISKDLFIQ